MKCEYCTSEPLRTCLKCGCLFCRNHGEIRAINRQSGQPFMNSQCMKCAEATRGQFSSVGTVFLVIAGLLTIVGAAIAAGTRVYAVGAIFLSQGIVFGALGLMFRLKYGQSQPRSY